MKAKPTITRLLTALLTLCMALSSVPMSAFAAELGAPPATADASEENSDGAAVETAQASENAGDSTAGDPSEGAPQASGQAAAAEEPATPNENGAAAEEPATPNENAAAADGGASDASAGKQDTAVAESTPSEQPAATEQGTPSGQSDAAEQGASSGQSDAAESAAAQSTPENPSPEQHAVTDAAGSGVEVNTTVRDNCTDTRTNVCEQACLTTQAAESITSVAVQNVKLDYQPGDAPQASAKTAGGDQGKYDISFECWKKLVKGDNDVLYLAGLWYSNVTVVDDRFSTFETGARYSYEVKLRAKDGYTFDSNLTKDNVTLNGASLPSDARVAVMDEGKTCLIYYGIAVRPGQAVDIVSYQPLTNFMDGDKPRFSNGAVGEFVDLDYECWYVNDGSGYGIASSDYWNDRYYNGKLIEKFKAGKTYSYGVGFKISEWGIQQGYRFDKNTKLCINGKEITLTPDQIVVGDDGETIWFSDVLTMTPTVVSVIDEVEIDGATVSFKDGDKPVFTEKNTPDDAHYMFRGSWWELDSNTGIMSTEPEWGSDIYKNKITSFEAGKTYHYGVFVSAYGDVGNTRYVFGPNTKLKINGKYVSYKQYEGYQPDFPDGTTMSMWVLTDLTMTPEAGGTVPAEKYTVTYTDGVDGEEVFADQTYTVESGATTPEFNGTPTRDGYEFIGWSPAVADTVTGDVTYKAMWKADPEPTVPTGTTTATNDDKSSDRKSSTDETALPKTGDDGNLRVAMLLACGFAAIGTAVACRKKRYCK